jgi:formimidoylglutamate deiminase
VLVNGQWVVRDGRHADEEESNRAFTQVLRDLLG